MALINVTTYSGYAKVTVSTISWPQVCDEMLTVDAEMPVSSRLLAKKRSFTLIYYKDRTEVKRHDT